MRSLHFSIPDFTARSTQRQQGFLLSLAINLIQWIQRWVIIPNCFSITISLQKWVGCNDLILQRPKMMISNSFVFFILNWQVYHTVLHHITSLNLHFTFRVSIYISFTFRSRHCDCCKVLDDTLSVDSLFCTRFATGKWNTHAMV